MINEKSAVFLALFLVACLALFTSNEYFTGHETNKPQVMDASNNSDNESSMESDDDSNVESEEESDDDEEPQEENIVDLLMDSLFNGNATFVLNSTHVHNEYDIDRESDTD